MIPRLGARPPDRPALAAVLLLGLASASATAQDQAPAPPGGPPRIDQQVVNDRPGFLVRAWVDKKSMVYAEGETLTLRVRSEQDALLYVLYQQADGKIFQIFPNAGQPDNRIKGMQDLQIPDPDDAFRWVITAPLGPEVIKVIASKEPIDALALPGLREGRFNPVSSDQIAGAGREMGKQAANRWTEHDLRIKTVRKGEPTEPVEVGRRVGVFFGVSQHQFNDEDFQAQQEIFKELEKQGKKPRPPKAMNLTCPVNDAADMAEKFKQVGRLSEVRVFRNSEATHANMREVITQWLPAHTRPGDTVFIYFSGHGAQIDDDDGDEKDKQDEILVPFDSMSIGALNVLVGRAKAGGLDPALAGRVQGLVNGSRRVYQQTLAKFGGKTAPGAEEKADAAAMGFLEHQTCLTDDEMGHWVQKLDGRRVVVILDACRSGGMKKGDDMATKGLDGRGARGRFDFLTGEFARLKDLDQPSLTVLTAATEEQNSLENRTHRNGYFTAYLLELLGGPDGPVDMKKAAEYTTAKLDEMFKADLAEIEEAIRSHPDERAKLEEIKADLIKKIFNPSFYTNDKPIYLKPPGAPSAADPTNNQED
jgi:Domain of unknown function (DUF4384)/Caspase domain